MSTRETTCLLMPVCADGYELLSPNWRPLNRSDRIPENDIVIAPRTTEMDYLDIGMFPALYEQFISTPSTVAGIKHFTERFGCLRHDTLFFTKMPPYGPHTFSDMCRLDRAISVGEWKILKADFEKSLQDQSNLVSRQHPQFDWGIDITGWVSFDRRANNCTMMVRPTSLLEAMRWQAMNRLCGLNDENRACKNCAKFFRAGPGTGARGDKRFCDRKCQNHWYNHRKRGRATQR